MAKVARSTRAWIETLSQTWRRRFPGVARSTRAWIETNADVDIGASSLSHALRVRGLKQVVPKALAKPVEVARSTRAWIETMIFIKV